MKEPLTENAGLLMQVKEVRRQAADQAKRLESLGQGIDNAAARIEALEARQRLAAWSPGPGPGN